MADAYVYQAALLCAACGERVRHEIEQESGCSQQLLETGTDSEGYPQGPYLAGGGEADSPQHCDQCGAFLYNPLTPDGAEYVRCLFAEHVLTGRGVVPVLTQWRDFYGYVWSEFIDETYPRLRAEGLTDEQRERFGDLCFD